VTYLVAKGDVTPFKVRRELLKRDTKSLGNGGSPGSTRHAFAPWPNKKPVQENIET